MIPNKSVFFLFVICVLLLFGTVSCNDDDDNFLFEIPYQATFTVPAGLNAFKRHDFLIRDIQNRLEDNLRQRGLTMADIKAVEPGIATFQALGSNYSMDFMEEITLNIYDENVDDLPYVEIFYLDFQRLRDAGSFIDLIPSLGNAQNELDESTFSVRVSIDPRTPNTQTFDAQLDFTLQVR